MVTLDVFGAAILSSGSMTRAPSLADVGGVWVTRPNRCQGRIAGLQWGNIIDPIFVGDVCPWSPNMHPARCGEDDKTPGFQYARFGTRDF